MTDLASWPSAQILSAAALVALLVDLVFGEPAARWHPVVWMGRYLGWLGPFIAPKWSANSNPIKLQPFLKGMAAWIVGGCAAALLAFGLQQSVASLAWPLQALLLGVLLKPMLAWRMLRDEVAAVDAALERSLAEGRERLSWLCSRDVSGLSAAEVRETAIETLAENLNDSVVAPLFWFLLAGLPGAALYRFANTADAMWGYRGERQGHDWTWAGKWAARADDALSWVPARITGVLLMLGQGGKNWLVWPSHACRTPSPNGGWPMAAMALGLGVRLGKPGVYTLNPEAVAPGVQHLPVALNRAGRVVSIAAIMAGTALLWTVA